MKTKYNFLLVDDDLDDHEIFQLAIAEIGCAECRYFTNGMHAISSLKTQAINPDIIFLDLNMPLMNGIQCLIEIKKIELISNPPIIIYSTSSDPRFYSESLMNGARDYIIKPHKLSDLVNRLIQTMQRELGYEH